MIDYTAEALRIAADESGYRFPSICYSPMKEVKVALTKSGTSRFQWNLELADYLENMPPELAKAFAESVIGYITDTGGGIPDQVRRWIRGRHTETYIRRNGFLRPQEVRTFDLERLARQLKETGQIPEDTTVLWTTDEATSYVSPTFRVVAVQTALLEEGDAGEIASEIIANARIMQRRSGA